MELINNKNTILLIDGYHLLHKGYYGSLKRKKIIENRDGNILNALCVFTAKILEFINSNRYHTIIVTFDIGGESCWRRRLYPQYKATRKETPPDLKPQMQLVRDFLTSANIPWYEKDTFEGDDIMGTIARIANKLGYDVEIMSNDKDIYQLINDKTVVVTQKTSKSDKEVITRKEVKETFGCNPDQIPDIKALMGDSSDNIKGICGLHYSTATKLITEYGTVENCIKNLANLKDNAKSLIFDNKEKILLNKKIAKINCYVDLGRIDFRPLRTNYRGFLWFVRKQKMWPFVKRVQELSDKNNVQKNPEVN